MVDRTQTSHLPDPFDPTPIQQGIGVYYCAMDYAGISFAIIEDRKFKSSPTVAIPEAKIINGWAKNPQFDAAKDSDVPGAVLLGERQLQFLNAWSKDWARNVWMKTVLSQTIFANVATLPEGENGDDIVPKLRIHPPGEYVENDYCVQDMDSNGWPQTGRNKALREMRRCFAFHLAGDQHLGSTIQYGVDDWHDASFAFCVPAIANIWPRRWFPPEQGKNHRSGMPKYTGDFKDGFGNLLTVHAISNPVYTGREPALLHDRATGYGIVRFNRPRRDITIECWPRYGGPSTGEQYGDWPITAKQSNNYNRQAVAWLPTLKVMGMIDPVVQIVDESNGETVYMLRIQGQTFKPKVFRKGSYTLIVGEPEIGKLKTIENVESLNANEQKTLNIGL